MKRTKIVCTIGPASEKPKMLAEMIKNGMNIARLNFSHNTHESHAQVIKNIRAVAKKLKMPVMIFQDLQGPKIRVSDLANPIGVKVGQRVVIGEDFKMDFDISRSVQKGHRILIEDGLLELRVEKVAGKKIYCRAKNAGTIRAHKGINMPDTRIKERVMPAKDVDDLKFGVAQDVDYVAQSFVRHAQDIKDLRKLILKFTPRGVTPPKIIAKIELPQAVEEFDQILAETDAVMIARGDLGVEIPESQVPVVQKMIIRKCRESAKPCIVATQMLDSMIRNPRPTRAEVSDVAGAVEDRVDAVMLSGESAYGKYPLDAVKTMHNIIVDTEKGSVYGVDLSPYKGTEPDGKEVSVIADSVAYLAENIKACAIVAATESGFTARFFSQARPGVRVVILTPHPKVYRQMLLLWGVTPVLLKSVAAVLQLIENALKETARLQFIKKGEQVVLVAGNPVGKRVNLIEVKTVK